MFEAADEIAVDDGDLERVIARRQRGAAGELERRGHTLQHRLQARRRRLAFDDPAVLVREHVAERQRPGGRVVHADVRMNHELHLPVAPLPLQREGRHPERQGGQRQRRGQAGHHGFASRSCPVVFGPHRELTARPHGDAAPVHRHVDRVRLAVLVERVRFDAEQVLTGKLRLDPLEGEIAAVDDVKQRSARRTGQHLDADRFLVSIVEACRRLGRPRLGNIEQLLVELHDVDAGACRRSEVVDLGEGGMLIVEHEALGDQDQRIRRVDAAERAKQVAEHVHRLFAVERTGGGDGVDFALDRHEAHLDALRLARRRGRRISALADLDATQHRRVAAPHGHRFGNRNRVKAPRQRLALASRFLDRLAKPLTVCRKGDGRRTRADANQRHAIGRLQAVDEAVDRLANADEPPEPDVGLIDHQQNEPAAAATFVRRVAFRRRRRLRSFGRRQRDPVGADHTPLIPIQANREVLGLQSQDRAAALVDDGHVDGRDVNPRPEPWRLILRARHADGETDPDGDDDDPACDAGSNRDSHGHGRAVNR